MNLFKKVFQDWLASRARKKREEDLANEMLAAWLARDDETFERLHAEFIKEGVILAPIPRRAE